MFDSFWVTRKMVIYWLTPMLWHFNVQGCFWQQMEFENGNPTHYNILDWFILWVAEVLNFLKVFKVIKATACYRKKVLLVKIKYK